MCDIVSVTVNDCLTTTLAVTVGAIVYFLKGEKVIVNIVLTMLTLIVLKSNAKITVKNEITISKPWAQMVLLYYIVLSPPARSPSPSPSSS